MFSSAHASDCEQYSCWKVKKQVKWDLILINQRRTRMRWDTVQYLCISHRSMGLKLQIYYPLSPAQCPRQIWFNIILLCPATFRCIWRSYFLWMKPNKSYVTHWTNPETHHTFIIDEPRWRTSWISTFWWRTKQHSDVHPGKHNNILMVRMFTVTPRFPNNVNNTYNQSIQHWTECHTTLKY